MRQGQAGLGQAGLGQAGTGTSRTGTSGTGTSATVPGGAYTATTNVVRAVMEMTRGVQAAKADQYVDLVRVSIQQNPHFVAI